MLQSIEDIFRANEQFESWRDHLPKYFSRGVETNPYNNCVAVLSHYEGRDLVKDWIYGMNLITNDGDTAYAQKSAGETVTTNIDFWGASARLVFRNSAATPAKTDTYNELNVAGTGALDAATTDYQAVTSGYPKTNDVDADNTGTKGVDVVTWLFDWATSELNATGIVGGGIVVKSADPPANTDKLLNHFTITSFNKDTSTSLKFFVNHEKRGV